jgi:hypothetical protein
VVEKKKMGYKLDIDTAHLTGQHAKVPSLAAMIERVD